MIQITNAKTGEKTMLVGMTVKTAQWLGMAASVAGGCIAVTDSGRDAASAVGHDCIGTIPSWWLPDDDYSPLSQPQIDRVVRMLHATASGWSGADRINLDRAQTSKMLNL